MSRFRKQSQTIWFCEYHLVWCPKYRFRVLQGKVKEEAEAVVREPSVWKRPLIKGRIGAVHERGDGPSARRKFEGRPTLPDSEKRCITHKKDRVGASGCPLTPPLEPCVKLSLHTARIRQRPVPLGGTRGVVKRETLHERLETFQHATEQYWVVAVNTAAS